VVFVLIVILVCTAFISAKFAILHYEIKKKKKEQQIITPSERIQLRKWSIAFAGIIVGILVGLSSALITYM